MIFPRLIISLFTVHICTSPVSASKVTEESEQVNNQKCSAGSKDAHCTVSASKVTEESEQVNNQKCSADSKDAHCTVSDEKKDEATKSIEPIPVWRDTHFYDFELTKVDHCDFKKMSEADILAGAPVDWSEPLVITDMKTNHHLIEYCSKVNMLKRYEIKEVVLSNSVTHAYERQKVTFKEYIDYIGKREPLEDALKREAHSTWYLCGDNWWPDMVQAYQKPDYIPGVKERSTVSFGLGGSSSGIPLHKHGQAFLEIFSGRKRWFTAPPNTRPPFDPEVSSFRWFHANEGIDAVHMCTQHVGEGLWLPDGWWHATLNIGETIFYLLFT